MRRKDREISNMEDIIRIIKKCDVCRLAFFDEGYPYIIPLNFGFTYDKENLTFYFHGAKEGKKLSLLMKNNKVGFEMDCSLHLVEAREACDYTMEYESVCGNGYTEFLEKEEKIQALHHLMKQYTKDKTFHFNEKLVDAVMVFKLKVENITGKRLSHS